MCCLISWKQDYLYKVLYLLLKFILLYYFLRQKHGGLRFIQYLVLISGQVLSNDHCSMSGSVFIDTSEFWQLVLLNEYSSDEKGFFNFFWFSICCCFFLVLLFFCSFSVFSMFLGFYYLFALFFMPLCTKAITLVIIFANLLVPYSIPIGLGWTIVGKFQV